MPGIPWVAPKSLPLDFTLVAFCFVLLSSLSRLLPKTV